MQVAYGKPAAAPRLVEFDAFHQALG